jgi:hypothetical protein
MKKFLGIYIGTAAALEKARWNELPEGKRKQLEARGMQAWADWGAAHAASIVEQGGPLGKTKRTAADGVTDITNQMVGYIIVAAESHDAAARLFEGHPHFSIFPGDSVEVMECLPVPQR